MTGTHENITYNEAKTSALSQQVNTMLQEKTLQYGKDKHQKKYNIHPQ